MVRREKEYRKLPGRKRTAWGSSTLWQGKDHLLLRTTTPFSETYRRFFFSDIQAIIVRCTHGLRTRLIVWTSVMMAGALLAFSSTDWGQYLGGGVAGIGLWLVVWNWWKGLFCVCHIRTALLQQEIPSLRRLPRAVAFRRIILPLIQQVQGTITNVELQAKFSGTEEGVLSAVEESSSPAPGRAESSNTSPAPPPPRLPETSYKGMLHFFCFGLLIVVGALNMRDPQFMNPFFTLMGLFLRVCAWVFAVMGLFRQRRNPLNRAVRFLTWTAAAQMVVMTYLQYFGLSFVGVASPMAITNWLNLSTWVSARIPIALGVLGLASLLVFYLQRARARR